MPNGHFNVAVYWDMFLENLKQNVAGGIITEKEAQEMRYQAIDMLAQNVPHTQLPQWYDLLSIFNTRWKDTLRSGGVEIVPEKIIQFGENYYDPSRGTRIAPTAALRELEKYYPQAKDNTLELQKLDIDKQQLQLDIQRERRLAGQSDAERILAQQQFGFQREQALWERGLQERGLALEEQRSAAEMRANPRQWIQSWFFEHGEDYPAQPSQMQKAASEGQWAIREAQAKRLDAESHYNVAQTIWMHGPSPENTAKAQKAASEYLKADVAAERTEKFWQPWISEQKQLISSGAYEGATPPQRAPSTPPWLSMLQPELKTGQPIRPVRPTTPSMQQWGSLQWSEREGAKGFWDYAGRPAEDVLSSMQQMLPTPRRPERWIPQFA